MPYFRVNLILIMCRPGWAEHQARKSMAEIIPEIDGMLAGAGV